MAIGITLTVALPARVWFHYYVSAHPEYVASECAVQRSALRWCVCPTATEIQSLLPRVSRLRATLLKVD